MHRWRFPSLSLHGIEGAFSEAGAKTVIPRKVIGKFSIRLVPDMDPKVVEKQVNPESESGVILLNYLQNQLNFLFNFHFQRLSVILRRNLQNVNPQTT